MDSEVVVEVRDLTMRFGDRLVHEHVDLDVRRGEILAIVGGSGAGKSTLLRQIVMLQRPTGGSIRVLGQEITALRERAALDLRRRIGVLFQQGALFADMSVLDNVAVPLREHTRLSARLIAELAALKLQLTDLDPGAGQLFPSQLSGGMRKRAGLARALALDPELLFLDEPTSGLDPITADALDALVLQLRASLGLTIVVVTHDIDSLWRTADRVVLLGQARVQGVGTMPELMARPEPAVREFFHGPRGRAAKEHAWARD